MAGKWAGNRKTARGGEALQAGGPDAIFSVVSKLHTSAKLRSSLLMSNIISNLG